MNFTILSQEQESEEQEQKPASFRVEVFEGIPYLTTEKGEKYAIWALLDTIGR